MYFLTVVLFILLMCVTGNYLLHTSAASAWAPNVAYTVGNQVTFQDATHPNHLYSCIQAHTSQTGWEPPYVPALWSDLGPVSTPTATPVSKTNTPTPTKTNTPSGGPTATKTATFVPPTATKTNTAVPPTATTGSNSFPVTENQFNTWYPNRVGLYTYANMITAWGSYSGFASSSNPNDNKTEAAGFFAHVAHETSYLRYTDEQNYTPGYYCASWDTHYLCAGNGADYHGRGPMQLTWNYNYKMASNGQYFQNGTTWVTIMTPTVGKDIWTNPNLVSSDGVVTWKTAFLFWMNHGKDWDPAKTTPHQDIINIGFGQTTMDVNGGIECGQGVGTVGYNEMQDRASIYTTFLSNLGVSDTRTKTC